MKTLFKQICSAHDAVSSAKDYSLASNHWLRIEMLDPRASGDEGLLYEACARCDFSPVDVEVILCFVGDPCWDFYLALAHHLPDDGLNRHGDHPFEPDCDRDDYDDCDVVFYAHTEEEEERAYDYEKELFGNED